MHHTTGGQPSGRTVFTVCGILALAFLVYSQTLAFAWDEGFHLLTAQLIKAGQRPYLDFLFPQPPLNAYWVACWMRIFGETWRTAQALSALESAAAVLLIADFLLRRFPIVRWRTPAALAAVLLFGLNSMVVEFGTEGQAYGLCLLCVTAAFRLSVSTAQTESRLLPFAAGFFAGAGACASLLTAPVVPVLLLWTFFRKRSFAALLPFAAGVTVPWLPVIWLFAKAPSVVWFGLAGYNIAYRRNGWGDPTDHDIGVLTAWIDSAQALTLGLLAIAGLIFIIRKSGWDAPVRAPFILCFWLALAQSAYLVLGRPTFERYYLLTVPFLSVLAVAGLYSLATRPAFALTGVGILMALGLGKALYQERDAFLWSDFEEIARKADQVTPRNGTLLADEHVYFLTRRRPPSGMELDYSHRLLISPEFAASLHVVLRPELNRRIHAGVYDTIATCEAEKAAAIGIPDLYRQKATIADCNVYWDFKR
jgi:hypothetical protein